MTAIPKKFGFIRTTLALWGASLFAGRAGVVTDSTPGPVERWGWYDGSAWKFSARSGASETFASLTLTRHLTLNGATRPAWGDNIETLSFGGAATLYAYSAFNSGSPTLSRNIYYDGTNFRARAAPGVTPDVPALIQLNAEGRFVFAASVSTPSVDGVISDLTEVFRVSKIGSPGFFGVNPPTTRPTVNAAATDLATAIALTNQLRTHLIAYGLVQ